MVSQSSFTREHHHHPERDEEVGSGLSERCGGGWWCEKVKGWKIREGASAPGIRETVQMLTPGFYPDSTMRPWAHLLSSLCVSFLICKNECPSHSDVMRMNCINLCKVLEQGLAHSQVYIIVCKWIFLLNCLANGMGEDYMISHFPSALTFWGKAWVLGSGRSGLTLVFLSSYVTLGRSLYFLEPQFSYLQNEDNCVYLRDCCIHYMLVKCLA